MKKKKHLKSNAFIINTQLENALLWLRAIKVIKYDHEVANKIGVSKATISSYLNRSRPVSGDFAYAFEREYLRKQGVTLDDFELPVLLDQARQLNQDDVNNLLEIISTKVIVIEGGVQTILDKLEKLEKHNNKTQKQLGELLKVKAKKTL